MKRMENEYSPTGEWANTCSGMSTGLGALESSMRVLFVLLNTDYRVLALEIMSQKF